MYFLNFCNLKLCFYVVLIVYQVADPCLNWSNLFVLFREKHFSMWIGPTSSFPVALQIALFADVTFLLRMRYHQLCTVKPLLSGHPLLNGLLSNSQKPFPLFTVNLTSIKRTRSPFGIPNCLILLYFTSINKALFQDILTR